MLDSPQAAQDRRLRRMVRAIGNKWIIIGDDGDLLSAIITRASCRALGLKPGVRAYGLVKATEVMVIRRDLS